MRVSKAIWFIFIAAFLTRLGLGWFALNYLPTVTDGSEPQQAGYLFYDAFHRDAQAFDLAASGAPLWNAFSQKSSADQYGGMLWFLAFIYRVLPFGHQPLIPIAIIALIGAAGVFFFHAAISTFVSEKSALFTTAAFAFYPESILLGASQMREPVLITLAALSFASFARIDRRDPSVWKNILFIFLLSLAVSPGIALLLFFLIAGWFTIDRIGKKADLKKIVGFGFGFASIVIIAVAMLAVSWEKIGTGSGIGVLGEWAKRTTAYNAHLLKQSSGIVQVVVGALPSIFILPFVTVYGAIQPVLPAVFFEPGEVFWKFVGSFRSIGWYSVLPLFLSYPFFNGIRGLSTAEKKRSFVFFITLIWILVAAARGGGDQWDNPRYRTILLPFILFISALVFEKGRMWSNLWFRKIVWIEVSSLLIFTHWYSWRYTGFGFNFGIRNTIVIAIFIAILIGFGDFLLRKMKAFLRL